MSDLPPDVVLDQKVEALIADGFPLPRWGFPTPTDYNGATGEERVSVWQKINIAWQVGWMPNYPVCSVCEDRRAQGWHQELYPRPFGVMPVCKSCHARIHRRFGSPERWRAFIDATVSPENWSRSLLIEQIARADAMRIAAEPDWLKALRAFSEARRAGR